MTTQTIYIVDDDDAVRASLHSLLSIEPNLMIRGFRSGDDFLELLDELDQGVVLLDFHMPGSSGLDVLKVIGKDRGRFAPIVLTGQGNINLAVESIQNGAVDFLEKPYDHQQLLAVIENAFHQLRKDSAAAARVEESKTKIGKLSARELDVLKGLIAGRSNKVIAHELDLSPRTVEIYRANMMDKLEVRSLSEALRIAFMAGEIPIE